MHVFLYATLKNNQSISFEHNKFLPKLDQTFILILKPNIFKRSFRNINNSFSSAKNIIIFLLTMLSVQPPIQMGRQEMSFDSNTVSERDEMPINHQPKQQEKKQFITPTKVVIGVAILCILAMASYKVYTITFPAPSENKMTQSHSKIIQHSKSSSGKDSSSQTGSQSSTSTKTSDKPIGVAASLPSKDKFSPNMGTGSGDDGEQPSEQDNDPSRRSSHLKKNRLDGSSTEEDSQQSGQQEEESGENEGQAVVWPPTGGSNGMPLVGSTRG